MYFGTLDLEEVAEALAVALIIYGAASVLLEDSSTSATTWADQVRPQGGAYLSEEALARLEDGGTLQLDRWHGGGLCLEAFHTVDIEADEEGEA